MTTSSYSSDVHIGVEIFSDLLIVGWWFSRDSHQFRNSLRLLLLFLSSSFDALVFFPLCVGASVGVCMGRWRHSIPAHVVRLLDHWWSGRCVVAAVAAQVNGEGTIQQQQPKKERKKTTFAFLLLSLSIWCWSNCCRVILFLFTCIKEETFIYSHDVLLLLLLFSFCAQQKRGFHSRFLSIQRGGTTTRKVQEPSRFRRTLMLMMRIQPTDFSRSLGGPPFSTWLVCVLDSYDDYYSLNNREIKNRLVFWRCLDMCSMFLVILLERQGCLSPFKCLMFSCRDSAVHKKKQLRDDVVLCLRTYR